MDTGTDSNRRRGRLPEADREQRRREVLAAASEELVEHGYEKSTMLSIARRAGASKETLYAWFGNKEGLFVELITANADGASEKIEAALVDDSNPRATLEGFAAGLMTLLVAPESVALNRSAMNSPVLAADLLGSGRHRVGPLVESYLAAISAAGHLAIRDTNDAFEVFYGLIIRDTQIRVLLGEPPPTRRAITERAARAVDDFFRLYRPTS